MYAPGKLKGEEAREQVLRDLRRMREAFAARVWRGAPRSKPRPPNPASPIWKRTLRQDSRVQGEGRFQGEARSEDEDKEACP